MWSGTLFLPFPLSPGTCFLRTHCSLSPDPVPGPRGAEGRGGVLCPRVFPPTWGPRAAGSQQHRQRLNRGSLCGPQSSDTRPSPEASWCPEDEGCPGSELCGDSRPPGDGGASESRWEPLEAAEQGGTRQRVLLKTTGEVSLPPGRGPRGPLGSGSGLPRAAPPRELQMTHSGHSLELPGPAWTASWTIFLQTKGPKPWGVKDLWAPSEGLTGTSSSVTKVPELHRIAEPPLPE